MNSLAEKYGDKLNILAFPCNQFGHQTNENNEEFLNTLKYVRPGGGFEVANTVTVFEKCNVNGASSHPLFRWLRSEVMVPFDPDGERVDSKGNTCADIDVVVLPRGDFGNNTYVAWSPVTRSDIAWNFEKFLIDSSGKVAQRYHRYHLIDNISPDIDALL